VLAWRVSISVVAGFCIKALKEGLARYGKLAIFNTCLGSQFTSTAFTAVLMRAKIAISMDRKRCWRDNVFMELNHRRSTYPSREPVRTSRATSSMPPACRFPPTSARRQSTRPCN